MIIGTGVFNLPHAFVSSGLLLGPIVLAICAFFGWLCLIWMTEVCARSQGISKSLERQSDGSSGNLTPPYLPSASSSPHRAERHHPERHPEDHHPEDHPENRNHPEQNYHPEYNNSSDGGSVGGREEVEGFLTKPLPKWKIGWRKLDISSISALFFGFRGKVFCQFCMVFYCLGVLWAYSSVFASSVSSLFFQLVYNEECDIYKHPVFWCNNAYYIALVVYAAIVVPLACAGIQEQAAIQMTMTLYRFSAFIVMFITILVAFAHPNPFVVPPGEQAAVDVGSNLAFTTLANFTGFGELFTTSAVALNFHFTIPDIVQPLADKKNIHTITTAALITATSFYMILGIIASMYFGHHTTPLVTFNWQKYTGLEGGWGGDFRRRPWWAVAVQLWIMFFPVLDMLSVFPLVGISLANSIQSFVPADVREAKWVTILCRLVATAPPIVFAAGLKQIDQIFAFTGLFAFFLEFLFPCALQWASITYCEKRWGSKSWWCRYSLKISTKPYVGVTLVFGFFALVFSMVVFIKNLVEAGKS